MTLRQRLLLAQVPLALALLLIGAVGVTILQWQGRGGERILEDNYRSALAAQTMKEALERMDSGALFIGIGERRQGIEQINRYRPVFERELDVQQHNITEEGEVRATRELTERWAGFRAALDEYVAVADATVQRRRYSEVLEPAFLATKDAADVILRLNQEAMTAKAQELRATSARVNTLMLVGIALAFGVGLVASTSLVNRSLRPLGVLSHAVRRLGEGDLQARAEVKTTGEMGQLAADFNAMAAKLRVYRESSLGELLQAQAASQAAIDSLPDPVIVFDTTGHLVNTNRTAESRLGISAEKNESLTSVSPELREVLERVRVHVASGKGAYIPRGYEEAVRIESAEGPWFLLPRAAPVYGEPGGITGVTVVLQDVTRLKRFDELKNDLVATVAHEFRTPLTSLRMAIHLLVESAAGPLNAKQSDLLYAAREDCERLQRIVDDLLDLSRIQTGQLELHLRNVQVEDLQQDLVEAHRSLAEDRGVVLTTSRDLDAETVVADPERIAVVLSNLVSNAIRHTPSGGNVEVGAVLGDHQVRFEVRDNGPGIAPEHLSRIFERFYRVPGAGGGAAGLGLSISRDIVRAHGGDIGVTSEPGKGSCFWFTVPVPSSEPER
ncbi:MAG: ATP-binding protein [Myxococcaceae bacterium]